MDTRSSVRRRLSVVLLVLGVVILAIANWLQRANVTRTQKENEQLRQQVGHVGEIESNPPIIKTVELPSDAPVPQPSDISTDTTAAAQTEKPRPKPSEEMVRTPTGYAIAPRASGLVLAGTHAAPIEGGLRVTMRFNPTIMEPLGIVAVVVRLPKESDSRILELSPTGPVKYTDVSGKVSDDGKFAIYQGTPESLEAIEINLSVSAPVIADVRGTCGIGPYDLKIDPSGATALQK